MRFKTTWEREWLGKSLTNDTVANNNRIHLPFNSYIY